MKSLNIVFAGTPAFALPCLQAISETHHNLVAVYTQPDRPAGRGQQLQTSAVKEWAKEHHVVVQQPVNFKDPQAVSDLSILKPDLMIVIAYGLILPVSVLNIPRFGCINVHASLLPRWRGASPIQHAILYGDKKTGVSIMQLDAGMDTGDVIEYKEYLLTGDETAAFLHDQLAELAVSPLLSTVEKIASGQIIAEPQDSSHATYAPKIGKDTARIQWDNSAQQIEQQIRAFNPWPVAFTQAQEIILRVYKAKVVVTTHSAPPGTILDILKEGLLVSTGKAALLIEQLQFPGGKRIAVNDWINAGRKHLHIGMMFA
jgi:methionyl-tRNA formyltransferase